MFSRAFLIAMAERAVRAFATTLASLWLIGDTALDLRDIDWGSALSLAGGTALGSVVISLIAGAGIGPKGSPSLVPDPAAAGPVHDPIDPEPEPEPEPTNVHRRRAEREDLAERLHARYPDPPDYPDPGVTGRGYQPGEHRRDPDLP